MNTFDGGDPMVRFGPFWEELNRDTGAGPALGYGLPFCSASDVESQAKSSAVAEDAAFAVEETTEQASEFEKMAFWLRVRF